jgi:hypothetical protein
MERPVTKARSLASILKPMRRHILWYILAFFWGAIALVGLLRHRASTAALEGAVALLFLIIGVAMKRRDAVAVARYTARRPR